MAKIITSKSSGKQYIQLENNELTEQEQDLVEQVREAEKAAAEALKALRDVVLARDEFRGKGFNQVYRSYGDSVKIGKGAAADTPKGKAPMSLADAMAAMDADGIAR